VRSLGKFLEGSIYFWVLLEKGVVEFQIYFFWGKQPWEKGVWRFEIALGLFLFFFGGGKPWKRESIDLRLLWDYFLKNFYRRQALKNAVWKFEIALGFFDFFFRRQALKNGVWRFEIALELFFIFFLEASLEKCSLEI